MILLRNARRFFYKALKQPAYALKVLVRRLKANSYYFITQGKSSYPEAITLFLTHRCNLRCKMCGQWGEGGVTKKQSAQFIRAELSLKDLINIVDDLASFKPNITLFGGEPLLHPGCVEIIRRIKQRGMHCLMITNGFLLEDLAQEIVDSGLDELNVSLDGNAVLHDEIRALPGLFNKIITGLEKVNYYKDKFNQKHPLINLQCTVNKHNYKKLEELSEVANLVKADALTFHNLIFLGDETLDKQKEYAKILGCSFSDWEGFKFEPGIDPGELYSKIKQIISRPHKFSIDFYPNFSRKSLGEYYNNLSFNPSDFPARCLSPWIVAYIFPDGQVRPCLNCSYSYGNIRNEKFAQIWNNAKALNYRRVLKANKLFPVCVRCTELYRY